MSNAIFVITVLVIFVGGLFGIAYILDNHRKMTRTVETELPSLGPVSRFLRYFARVLVVIMVVSAISIFLFRRLDLFWIIGLSLSTYLFLGILYRTMKSVGK